LKLENIAIKPEYFDFDAKAAVNSNAVTLDDLDLIYVSDMKLLHDEIIARIRCMNGFQAIKTDDIFSREYIENMIPENKQHVFKALKQTGYIGVCGRGYTINSQIKLTDAEYERVTKVIWEILPALGL